MTFEQLEYVAEVTSTGTIFAAAQNLHVSHTAISRAISKFEDELGFPVFIRTRNGSVLTPNGEKVLDLIRSILSDAEQMKQLCSSAEQRTLRIGAFPKSSIFPYSDVVAQFNKSYPNVSIILNDLPWEVIVSQLKDSSLDIGLIILPSSQVHKIDPALSMQRLFESRLMIVCNPQSRLAEKASVTPQELVAESFVLQNDTFIQGIFNEFFTTLQPPQCSMSTNSNDLIKSAVMQGNGIAIYNDVYLDRDPLVQAGLLKCLPIEINGEPFKLAHLCLRSSKRYSGSLAKEFIALAKHLIETG